MAYVIERKKVTGTPIASILERQLAALGRGPMAVAHRHLHPLLMMLALICLGWAPSASATPVVTHSLSEFSSETDPPASVLDATLGFNVSGNTLWLTVSNTTTAPDTYDINGFWFNGSAGVTGLSLVSATHSDPASGDVTAAWTPVETSSHVAGFGTFDFGLTVPSNQKKGNLIGSGQYVVFAFTISGTGPFTVADFYDVPNELGIVAAGKFVSGPGDRSAFGATNGSNTTPIPEPATAALLGAGLFGLGWAGRRRR